MAVSMYANVDVRAGGMYAKNSRPKLFVSVYSALAIKICWQNALIRMAKPLLT